MTGLRTRAEAEAEAARRSADGDRAMADVNRAWWRWRVSQFFAAVVPATMVAGIVCGLLWLLLAGCAPYDPGRQAAGYTTRDEIRASCASAAHAYGLAVERTRAGQLSAETFEAVADGYDGVVATCRAILVGGVQPEPADAAVVATWTRRTEATAR